MKIKLIKQVNYLIKNDDNGGDGDDDGDDDDNLLSIIKCEHNS